LRKQEEDPRISEAVEKLLGDIAALLADYDRQRDDLKAALDAAQDRAAHLEIDLTDANASLNAAEAERDRLRAALGRFVDLARNPHVQGLRPDGLVPVPVATLRDAERAFGEGEEGNEP
jgi:chromosome segregation ATPase